MDLPRVIRFLAPDVPEPALSRLESAWTPRYVARGTLLVRQGEPAAQEIVLLDGRAVSLISDAEGRGVCVGMHAAPGIVTPHVARSRDSVSLVSVETVTDATIAEMPAEALMALMLESVEIRDWANGILRDELARKTEREWCLAALGGAERLNWFREHYPDHEATFAHGFISSFLGMTPVTLSRLRQRA